MTGRLLRLPEHCRLCLCDQYEDRPWNGGTFTGRHFACGMRALPPAWDGQGIDWMDSGNSRAKHEDMAADLIAAMRPVVEAAMSFDAATRGGVGPFDALSEAVDAYRETTRG